MNKVFLSLALSFISFVSANAQLGNPGYYRVQNTYTERYIIMTDNKSDGVNYSTTEPDLGALETLRPFSTIVSDPSSVIYIENVSGINYNLEAQGANAYNMIGYYLKIPESSGGAYRAYGESSGTRIYICDMYGSDDRGIIMTSGSLSRDWYITPISSSTDNYFGFTPEVAVGDKYYTTLYADFPFEKSSDGLKFYYISKVDATFGAAIYQEINGTVGKSVPVIVECASSEAAGNKIELVTSTGNVPSGNLLGGVYFMRDISGYHRNVTAYDSNTMRVLGTCSDGSIGFVTSDITYLPANKAYLTVPSGSPTEFKLMTQAEYEGLVAGISSVKSSTDKTSSDIYTITGNKVRTASTSTDGLPKGIYIIGGKKVVVK